MSSDAASNAMGLLGEKAVYWYQDMFIWRTKILIVITPFLFLFGCGDVGGNVQQVSDGTSDESVEDVGDVYKNDRFGYSFVISSGVTVYGIKLDDQTAVPADPQSEIVFVPGEGTNYLTARVIETRQSVHEWLTENLLFFYPSGVASQKVDEVDGRLAIILRGDGTTKSPARLMVLQGDEKLLVITFERDEAMFDELVASLKIK